MSKLNVFLEEKLMPVGSKVGQNRYLSAIRDGMMSMLPLIILGGIVLIVAFPPINTSTADPSNVFLKPLLAWAAWASANMGDIMAIYSMSMALMAIAAVMGISYSLANKYKMDGFSCAITSVFVFLVTAGSATGVVLSSDVAKGGDALKNTLSALPTTYFDGKGLFTAMFVGIITVEITKFLWNKGIIVKMPEGVPPAIAKPFNSLIPFSVNMLVFYFASLILRNTTGMNLPQGLLKVLSPAIGGLNTIWGLLFLIFFAQVLWICGIHGSSIMLAIMGPIFATNLAANASAMIAGQPMPEVLTEQYWAFYVALAGSGATFPLVLFYLRSKSEQLKAVGKVALLPGIFNINEPITFGSPIVMNPVLGIPFIVAPLVNVVISYVCTSVGLVGKAFAGVPWTTPAPIGAAISTMDFKAFILVLVLLGIDCVIYYPFFKAYEKQLVKQEVELKFQ